MAGVLVSCFKRQTISHIKFRYISPDNSGVLMVTKLASKLKIICRSANGFFDLVSVPKLSKTAVNRKGSMDCNEITHGTKLISTASSIFYTGNF